MNAQEYPRKFGKTAKAAADPGDPLALIVAATRKATKGRKASTADLTGPERRRTVRILQRRERRLAGLPAGATAPSLSARRLAPSSFALSVTTPEV